MNDICQACGYPGRANDPVVVVRLPEGTFRVHRSHTVDPKSGLYGAEVIR